MVEEGSEGLEEERDNDVRDPAAIAGPAGGEDETGLRWKESARKEAATNARKSMSKPTGERRKNPETRRLPATC